MRKYKFVSIRKFGIFTLTFALIVGTAGITTRPGLTNSSLDSYGYIMKTKTIDSLIKQSRVESEVRKKPQYQLNLDERYQSLIWQLCEENNFSYELALAVFYHESEGFKVDAVNHNRDGSRDFSIAQINSRQLEFYKECAYLYGGLSKDVEFNVLDPEMNIRAGVGGLVYLRNHYQEKGVDGENLVFYVLGSYHMGQFGYESYIAKYNYLETKYASTVLSIKYKLEREGVLE